MMSRSLHAILIFFLLTATGVKAQEIEIKKSAISDRSIQYQVHYSDCSLSLVMDLVAPGDSRFHALDLGQTAPCREASATQLNIFREMLKRVASDGYDFGEVGYVGLPKIDFAEDFLVGIARSAYASKKWRKSVSGKKAGAGANIETLGLLKEVSAYDEFADLLRAFDVEIRLVSVEKVVLAKVSDLARRNVEPASLSGLSGTFLVPLTASPRFKVMRKVP